MLCLKRPIINEKEAGVGPFKNRFFFRKRTTTAAYIRLLQCRKKTKVPGLGDGDEEVHELLDVQVTVVVRVGQPEDPARDVSARDDLKGQK